MNTFKIVRSLRLVAVATLIGWIVIALVRDVSSRAELICAVVLMVLLVVCWVASVWLWAQVATRSIYHTVALPLLLIFGFVWGWAYILAAAGSFADERT